MLSGCHEEPRGTIQPNINLSLFFAIHSHVKQIFSVKITQQLHSGAVVSFFGVTASSTYSTRTLIKRYFL